MAGLTHSALRTAILDFGGIGLLSTKMLAAARLPAESARTSPYLVRTAREKPLSYQLLLTPEQHIPLIFVALHRLGADVVDLNLGCPAPLVRRAGGGSSLMEDPAQVRRMVRTARQHTALPLTAKIRLGESLDEARLRDFCTMLADEGIDMLTVHARLRRESFARPPRWDWVGRVKAWVPIPVVANGGIDSVATAQSCLQASGADGLMIGRRAAVEPWVFAEIARALYQPNLPPPRVRLPRVYRDLVLALAERFAPERRLGRLKEFTHYFAKNYPFGHHLASRVQSSETLAEAWSRAREFFRDNDADGLADLPEEVGPEAVVRDQGAG